MLKLSKRDDIKPKAYALKGLFYEGFLRLRFEGRLFFFGGGGGGGGKGGTYFRNFMG